MKKKYSDHIKLFADGYPILVKADIRTEWRKAESPHDIIDAWAVKRATQTLETKRFVWRSQNGKGPNHILTVTPEEEKEGTREGWVGFVEWIDTTWQAHEAPLPKGAPRPHAEVMKAWADGARMKWKPNGGRYWIYEGDGFVPQFGGGYTYEVAPEVVRYRRAVFQPNVSGSAHVATINEREGDPNDWFRNLQNMGYSVFWIDTEWQTAEVPQGDSK